MHKMKHILNRKQSILLKLKCNLKKNEFNYFMILKLIYIFYYLNCPLTKHTSKISYTGKWNEYNSKYANNINKKSEYTTAATLVGTFFTKADVLNTDD